MTQSYANCSLRQIPRSSGKIQGIFAISTALGSNWDQISLVFSRVFDEIPYSTKQGIILEEQGIFSMEQGIFRAEQGNSSGGRRGAKLLCFRRGWSYEEAQRVHIRDRH